MLPLHTMEKGKKRTRVRLENGLYINSEKP